MKTEDKIATAALGIGALILLGLFLYSAKAQPPPNGETPPSTCPW